MRTKLSAASSRIDYGLTTSATPGGVGPKFLRITDIEGSDIDWAKVPTCDADLPTRRKYKLDVGDLVVARTGASVGRSQWIRDDVEAVFASYLVRFRVGGSFNARFVGYVLQSRQWNEFVDSVAHGKSAQPNMSASAMADFSFEHPERREQDAIAEVLGALDDKIAANTKLVTVADDLVEAIVREATVGQPTAPLLSDAAVVMGSSPKGESFNSSKEGVLFHQGIRDFGTRFPAARVFTTAPTRLAQEGDTLLSVRAPVGRVNLAPGPIAIGRGLASVRSRDGRPSTLFNVLKSAQMIWEPFEAEGTVFGSINRGQLESIQIPQVHPERQRQVERKLAEMEAAIASTLAESRTLATLRDTLLPQLMSGKLRVRDAERTLSEVL